MPETTREQRDEARDALDCGVSCGGAIMAMERSESIEDTLRLILDEVEEGKKAFRTMGHLGDSCGRLLKRAEAAEDKLRRIAELVDMGSFSDKAECLDTLEEIVKIAEAPDA